MGPLTTERRKEITRAFSIQCGWTDERIKELRHYVAMGLSAGRTAKILKITRNAVLGKAIRLGLHFNGYSPAPPRPKPRPISRYERPTPPDVILKNIEAKRTARITAEVNRPTDAPLATIFDLGSFMCRWPIGHPGDDDFGFCGRYARTSRYCEAHSEIARSKADPREVTRRALAR